MAEQEKIDERRRQRGTRFWVSLNLFLFPIPAYFTLLRIRTFSLKKGFLHLGIMTLLLVVLLAAAALQVLFPAIGRLWMIMPIASGIMVIAFNQRLITQFPPDHRIRLTRRQTLSLLLLLALLTVISILPDLDLIELEDHTAEAVTAGITIAPLWQRSVILVIGTLILFAGYLANAGPAISLNRLIILYACFFVIASQIGIVLFLACKWLHLSGGLSLELITVFLAAILALDYWDAASFGQFTRRYALLTLTKMLSFLFVWLSFCGLPQKAAATYLSHYSDQATPPALALPADTLLYPYRGIYNSGHQALRRTRILTTEALLSGRLEKLARLSTLLKENGSLLCTAGDDVCRLTAHLDGGSDPWATPAISEIPFFRPVGGAWDVFLSALVRQKTISASDLPAMIAEFKTRLPKSSAGNLPDIDTPYDSRFVSLATGTVIDFIPPSLENIDVLLAADRVPVLPLPFSGRIRWGALIFQDHAKKLAWFRIEAGSAMDTAIQTRFDAGDARQYRPTILSSQIAVLSMDYLATIVPQIGDPMVVMTPHGLDPELRARFGEQALAEIRDSVAQASQAPGPSTARVSRASVESGSGFARYLTTVQRLSDLIAPKSLGFNIFPDPRQFSTDESWRDRLDQAAALLREAGPLKDWHRLSLASRLEKGALATAHPNLFVQLALPFPVSTNMVSCNEALTIGRRLYLMGRYPEAHDYLKVARARHPYNSEYALWFQLVRLKLDRPPEAFHSPPEQQAGLWLYYQTLRDLKRGKSRAARNRLEKAVERDSHDAMANHLLATYFKKPLDEKYFFPSPEGL